MSYTPADNAEFLAAIAYYFDNTQPQPNGYQSDITNWNTVNITNMSSVFSSQGQDDLKTNFNENISNWNVSNVTVMDYMFTGCTAFNQPIQSWDVSKVTNMSNMFLDCNAFNQPIQSWNVSNVTNMAGMFQSTNAFNQPIQSWNVSNVTNMCAMFAGAAAFNQPIRSWNVTETTLLDETFAEATAMALAFAGTTGFGDTPLYTFFNVVSSFFIPGSLDISLVDLSDVNDPSNNIQATFTATVKLQQRAKASLSTAVFNYFIEAEYDINSAISVQHDDKDEDEDDSWGLSEIIIDKTTQEVVSYKLPTASDISVPAGVIEVKGVNGETSLGNFPVTITMSIDSSGKTSASVAISGSELSTSVNENTANAQVLYFAGFEGAPSVADTTADVLTKTIDAEQVTAKYYDELAEITKEYNNQDVISAWRIKINSIEHSTNNDLSKHARNYGITNKNVFSAGEKIVAQDHFQYTVSVLDYTGNNTVTIASGQVYGVVKQKAVAVV